MHLVTMREFTKHGRLIGQAVKEKSVARNRVGRHRYGWGRAPAGCREVHLATAIPCWKIRTMLGSTRDPDIPQPIFRPTNM